VGKLAVTTERAVDSGQPWAAVAAVAASTGAGEHQEGWLGELGVGGERASECLRLEA
jgi:hypothetical protein